MNTIQAVMIKVFLSILLISVSVFVESQSQCLSFSNITTDNISSLSKIQEFTLEARSIPDLFWTMDEQFLIIGVTDTDGIYNRILFTSIENINDPLQHLKLSSPIEHMWSSTSNQLVIATRLSEIDEISELDIDTIEYVPHNVDEISISGDLGIIAGSNTIEIVDINSNQIVAEFLIPYTSECEIYCNIESIVFNNGAKQIVYSVPTYTLPSGIITIDTGETIEDPQIALYGLAFNLDDSLIVSTLGSPNILGRQGFVITDSETGIRLTLVRSSTNSSTNAVFSPDGELVVFTATDDNSPAERLVIWSIDQLLEDGESDVESALYDEIISSTPIHKIVFHPSGKMITITHSQKNVDDTYTISIWGIPMADICDNNNNQ